MRKVPFFSLEPLHANLRAEIMKAIERVYDQNSFVLGSELANFEKNYALYTGVDYCAGVASGFDALVLSLRSAGIGAGDEVVVPTNTFVATWMAVSAVGATIVPAEPHVATYNIDPKKLESAITSKTRCVIPVHLYGQACQMDDVMRIAASRDINVVEDNAQAHGAEFNKKRTGSFGYCSATSFYPVKNIGALGDAGAITTMDPKALSEIRALRNHGAEKRPHHTVIGVNSRMDEIQAAVLNVKLRYIDQHTAARRALAKSYLERLRDCDITLPTVAPGCTHVYHLFVIRSSRRDALISFLNKRGVETHVHYPIPPHLQAAYAHLRFANGRFPIAEELGKTSLSLPLWPGMTDDQVDWVCDSIRAFFS